MLRSVVHQSKAGKRSKRGVMYVILNRVSREDHTDKVTSEQRPKGGEGESLGKSILG